ncbi:hypothetical protein NDU88_004517 [Pleurodeles waltl]|uniref:Uncharacterized protein n=1 Tax=Pleurodeles waltl TaxID=8319 RepID=A0AAV7KZP8_PLEWA|nr:hypothetical protein NDU88_004517 [Pleurodeles waltl]
MLTSLPTVPKAVRGSGPRYQTERLRGARRAIFTRLTESPALPRVAATLLKQSFPKPTSSIDEQNRMFCRPGTILGQRRLTVSAGGKNLDNCTIAELCDDDAIGGAWAREAVLLRRQAFQEGTKGAQRYVGPIGPTSASPTLLVHPSRVDRRPEPVSTAAAHHGLHGILGTNKPFWAVTVSAGSQPEHRIPVQFSFWRPLLTRTPFGEIDSFCVNRNYNSQDALFRKKEQDCDALDEREHLLTFPIGAKCCT